jgi:hypothetical protein
MSNTIRPGEKSPRDPFANSLPNDLAAAYKAAGHDVLICQLVVGLLKVSITTQQQTWRRKRLADVGELIESRLPDLLSRRQGHQAIPPVLADLIRASEPSARFGSSCAHEAAVDLTDRLFDLMWQSVNVVGWFAAQSTPTDYPVALVRSDIKSVARAVAAEPWPDFGLLHNAIQGEAARATGARKQQLGQATTIEGKTTSLGQPDIGPDHGIDFVWVRCELGEFNFSKNQRDVVKALWLDWERGGSGISAAHLLEHAEAVSAKLSDVFKNHPAFGVLIIRGDRKDVYRLAMTPVHKDKADSAVIPPKLRRSS